MLDEVQKLANSFSTTPLDLKIEVGSETPPTGSHPGDSLKGQPKNDKVGFSPLRFEGRLNPAFTFDTHIGGKSNQLARAAAKQVGENPGQAYNPLFLYGGVGLGKTHLMQAAGNLVMSSQAKAKVVYVHSERFVADMVRDEKLKVIRSLGSVDKTQIVRGQYWENAKKNYRLDVEDLNSNVESYVALKVSINNLRWAGTPFYLRTGKKMKNQLSEIALVFKTLPHSIFDDENSKAKNKLIIRLQPNDGITLKTNIKDPGPGGMRIVSMPLDMTFAETMAIDSKKTPDAYERLIMDVIRGDQTLFMRGDEVEEAWRWTDTVVKNWESPDQMPDLYTVGSAGPKSAEQLISADGRKWRDI